MKRFNPVKFMSAIGISLAAGAVGSIFTYESIQTWYTTLNKPFFNPPNWVFGPVWTVLYVLMGISLYIIWNEKSTSSSKKTGIVFFFIQLVLNTIWSILFFGLQAPGIAFVEILILLFSIVYTSVYFSRISKIAAVLLVPYMLWVTFASILNFAIFILN